MTKKFFRPYREGDGGTILMPLVENVAEPHEDWVKKKCPMCGAECYETRLHRLLMRMEPGVKAACTKCALRVGKAKGAGRG